MLAHFGGLYFHLLGTYLVTLFNHYNDMQTSMTNVCLLFVAFFFVDCTRLDCANSIIQLGHLHGAKVLTLPTDTVDFRWRVLQYGLVLRDAETRNITSDCSWIQVGQHLTHSAHAYARQDTMAGQTARRPSSQRLWRDLRSWDTVT